MRYLILDTARNSLFETNALLEFAEEVYADFDYPEDMNSFIKYMPVSDDYNPSLHTEEENLKHFGYENVIQIGDIQDIKEHYDVAIIDLPYGHFNPIAPEIQQMIMNEARRIADELIIVTQVNMDEQLKQAGFEIVERCEAVKGKFVRYITMCR